MRPLSITVLRPVTLVLLVVFFSGGMAGCTYTGPLRPDFYEPAPPPDRPLPVTLALRRHETQTFTYVPNAPNFHSFEAKIELQPELDRAAQEEFSRVFEEVRLIDGSLQEWSSDLMGTVDFRTEEVTRLGTLIMDMYLVVVLKDRMSGKAVATYQKKDRVTIPDPPEAITAYFVTAASFFLFSPATIPWTTNAIGHYATEVLQREIQLLLHAVSQDMRTDKALRAYADARP